MPKILYPYSIHADWVEVFCHLKAPLCEGRSEKGRFILSVKPAVHRHYSKQGEIYCLEPTLTGKRLRKLCKIWFAPRSSVLHPASLHLKMENSVLYSENWFAIFGEIMSAFPFEYVSLKRLDIAYDCERLKGGRSVPQLLADYVTQKVLKVGQNRPTCVFNSLGYKLSENATEIPKGFHVGGVSVSSMTWGKITSGKQLCVYNKSKELREVKYKPWIVEAWERDGLKSGADVWRFEMRLSGQGLETVLFDSGDMYRLQPSEASTRERLVDVFGAYAVKLCYFVKRDYHVKRQQMKRLDLFSFGSDFEPSMKPKICKSVVPTNRTVRMLRNCVEDLQDVIERRQIDCDIPDIQHHLQYLHAFFDSAVMKLPNSGKSLAERGRRLRFIEALRQVERERQRVHRGCDLIGDEFE